MQRELGDQHNHHNNNKNNGKLSECDIEDAATFKETFGNPQDANSQQCIIQARIVQLMRRDAEAANELVKLKDELAAIKRGQLHMNTRMLKVANIDQLTGQLQENTNRLDDHANAP